VLSFGGPRRGDLFRWAVVAALATVASCWLVVSLTRHTAFSADPGEDGADPQAPRDREVPNLCEALDQCAAERYALAGEVIEGRLTLLRAAARFRDLNARPPMFNWRAFRKIYPGDSDDERHCRQVIHFVRQGAQLRPGADPAVADRLEAELGDLLERGDLRLPGPDDVPDR
jgi:hypothetical protein